MADIRRRTLGLTTGAVIVVLAGFVGYLFTRAPGQARVNPNLLPTTSSAHRAAAYLDCSKVNAVAYDPHNPCQTFLLLETSRFGSPALFLEAEAGRLRAAGWRHAAEPIPADANNGSGSGSLSESWVAPEHRACAYVTTVRRGLATEAQGLFPYDPYNQPPGVLDFYRKARAVDGAVALRVRLEPPAGEC
ncbi:MAG: hypothetical protein WAK93_12375 [Solirubrobacteraceae bacterium]